MTDQFLEIPQDQDFHILLRVISCCTLGLWAFATGLLIGVFLFSWSRGLPLPPKPGKIQTETQPDSDSQASISHNAGRMVSPITVAVVAEDGRGSSAKIEMEAARRVMQ
jgi:hypothetical protein